MGPNKSGMLPGHSQTFMRHVRLKKHASLKMFFAIENKKTIVAKVDLTWQLWHVLLKNNAHTLNIFLSCGHQICLFSGRKHDNICKT